MESHCLKQTSLPHSTRLFTDFLYHFDRVRPFYSFDPFDDHSFSASAGALSYPRETREAVFSALEEQAAAFAASQSTRSNLDRFRKGAMAVVTGQQVGFWTGPVFAFYKAMTAIRLAETLTERGLDSVPVFWLATDDHDLEEVNHAFLLDSGYQPQRINADTAAPGPHAPAGEIVLGPGTAEQTEQALRFLPQTEWMPDLADALRESYRPGATLSGAFGKLMARLAGRFGVILLDPAHPLLRRLAAPVFRSAIEHVDDLHARLLARDEELLRGGYHTQVHVTEQSTLLFLRSDGQRTPLRRQDGQFLLGDAPVTARDLLSHLERDPADFSPNVLLRPVVQDALLPTVAYVGGPAELAYFAQVDAIYRPILGRAPLVYPRATFTLLDSRARELLARYRLTIEDVLAGQEALRDKLAERSLPPDLAAAFDSGEHRLSELLKALQSKLEDFDPTLADAMETSGRKMTYQFGKIRSKAARSAAARSSELDRDAALLANVIYPHKTFQERVYSGISFLARFGPGLLDRLSQQISLHCGDHQVLSL